MELFLHKYQIEVGNYVIGKCPIKVLGKYMQATIN